MPFTGQLEPLDHDKLTIEPFGDTIVDDDMGECTLLFHFLEIDSFAESKGCLASHVNSPFDTLHTLPARHNGASYVDRLLQVIPVIQDGCIH